MRRIWPWDRLGDQAKSARHLTRPQPGQFHPTRRAMATRGVAWPPAFNARSRSMTRSAYSLRHTYICMRLMEGADIYQIAKNCRTSVEMIEKFYASHIRNTLDAAAINVRKARARKAPSARKTPANARAS